MDVEIQVAGCLIWVGPRKLGGLTPKELSDIWMGTGKTKVEELVRDGTMLPLSLYQDDGYTVRFITGELPEQESEEWVARATTKLKVPCGEIMVCGVLTPDFNTLEYPKIEKASDALSTEFGCYVPVKAGEYEITVYSYAPGDLSGTWMAFEEEESSEDYFKRTRKGAELPAWVTSGEDGEYDETRYVNFVVQIKPPSKDLEPPQMEDAMTVGWETRKPELCPLGIPASFQEE